ncbi:MAG: CPBP family intramembrane metalloprotease [Chloroflexi bacterium]|nr:CPBP family intramembrane metalloprotease [Chloroflexota bacterium]
MVQYFPMSEQAISPPVQQPPPQPKKRVLGPWPTLLFGLVIGLIAVVVQGIVAAVIFAIKVFADGGAGVSSITGSINSVEGLIVSVATILSAAAALGIMAVIVSARTGRRLTDYLSLRKLGLRTVLIVLGVGIAYLVVAEVLTALFDQPSSEFMFRVYRTAVWAPLLWIAVIVFAPVFEESFFRGFLFEGLVKSRLGLGGTAVLTSVSWAALHILQYGTWEIGLILALGIVLTVVRHVTGSLWSTIIIHSLVNLVASIQMAYAMG